VILKNKNRSFYQCDNSVKMFDIIPASESSEKPIIINYD